MPNSETQRIDEVSSNIQGQERINQALTGSNSGTDSRGNALPVGYDSRYPGAQVRANPRDANDFYLGYASRGNAYGQGAYRPAPAVITSSPAKKLFSEQLAGTQDLYTKLNSNNGSSSVPTITQTGAGYQIKGQGKLYSTAEEAFKDFQSTQSSSQTAPVSPNADDIADSIMKRYGETPNIPAGWDAQTYANFKSANPDLEPTPEDTQRMLGADNNGLDNYVNDLSTIQGEHDQLFEQYKTQMDQFQNGTWQLSPEEQAYINAAKKQLDQVTEAQKVANKNFEGAITNAGIAAGRNRYAPEIYAGEIQNAITTGLDKVSTLEGKALTTLYDLKTAIRDKKYATINDLYTKTNEYLDKKSQAIKDTHDAVVKAADDARKAARENLDDATKRGQSIATYYYSQLGDDEQKNGQLIQEAADRSGLTYEQMYGLMDEARIAAAKAKKESYLPGTAGEWQYYSELTPDQQAQFNDYLDLQADRQGRFAATSDAYGNPLLYNSRTSEIRALPDVQSGDTDPGSMMTIPKALRPSVEKITGSWDNEQINKTFNKISEAKLFVDSLDTSTKNAADDQALIYSFAKAMDPDSVVREGEYNTVQKYSQSWLKTFGFNANRTINDGTLLSKSTRERLKKTIDSKFSASQKQYDNLFNEYGRRIDQITGRDDGTQFLTDYGRATQPQSLDQYYKSNPDRQQQITDFMRQHPDYTDDDVLQIFQGQSQARGSATQAPLKTMSITRSVVTKYPTGSVGGQCGDFVHKICDIPSMGNTLQAKEESVRKSGVLASAWRKNVRVGDVIITNESKTWGHAAVVTRILPNGKIQLSESNYHGNERVSNDRILSVNDPHIYGALRGKIKPSYQQYSLA